jgi:hypothetical protein
MNERIDGSRNVAQRLRELAEGIEGTQELWVDGQRLVASSEVSATVEAALEGDGSARLVVTVGLGSALRPQSHPLERELSWPGD